MSEVCEVNIPALPQFSVQNILNGLHKTDAAYRYLPDMSESQAIPRRFLVTGLNTLKPGYFTEAMERIYLQRESQKEESEQERVIRVMPEFYDILTTQSVIPMKSKDET